MKTEIDIYTDASFSITKKDIVKYAAVSMNWDGDEHHLSGFVDLKSVKSYFKWNKNLNITIGEMIAILKVLWTFRNEKNVKLRIFSDSEISIGKFNCKKFKNKEYKLFILKYRELLNRIIKNGGDVELCWIKSHCGVVGNEIADKLCKKVKVKENIEPFQLEKNKLLEILN